MSSFSDAIRSLAQRDELRFNDQGRLVPVEEVEAPEPDESGEQTERHAEGSGDGGRGKSNAARAVKLWTSVGQNISNDDLPAMLKATILDVRVGKIEPAVATAIATLAKASIAITVDIDLEKRIEALEREAGLQSSSIRRIK